MVVLVQAVVTNNTFTNPVRIEYGKGAYKLGTSLDILNIDRSYPANFVCCFYQQ